MHSLTAFARALPMLVLAACSAAGGSSAERTEELIPVRLAAVEERWVSRPITGTGIVSSREEITLSFKIGGVVARVLVREGETVHRGQTLALLDLREIDAQVAKARSARARAERDLDRATRLHADSVATLEQLQNARTAAEVSELDVRTAEVNRQYAVIVAPADGRILRRTAEPGELVMAGVPVLTVGSTGSGTVLRVGLADRDAVRLQAGDSAIVTFDAWPTERLRGRVLEMPAATTPGTRAHEIQIAFDPGGRAIASGMVGAVQLYPAEGREMPVVPVASVVEADGESATVFALDAGGARARRIPVRIATLQGEMIAISEGLEGITHVIAAGAAYVSDGSAVRIVP